MNSRLSWILAATLIDALVVVCWNGPFKSWVDPDLVRFGMAFCAVCATLMALAPRD
jgi:hypothetical protein